MIFGHVPPIHPDASVYMEVTAIAIDQIWWLNLAKLIVDSFLLVGVIYLIYRVWFLADRIEVQVASASEDRQLTTDLLRIVKGWAVVNVSAEKIKTEAAKDLKEAVALVPEKTADKVVEKIEEKHESGSRPRPPH